jgi:NitT/TauT family transport system ATP-binding protein
VDAGLPMKQAVDFVKRFEASFPSELSGGMRKRVALAQVLVYDPGTLLMDEPFGALDAQLKLLMQAELLKIWEESRKTVVFVTHDLAEAVTLASRVVVFSGRPGRIKAIEDVPIAYPRDPFRVRFRPEFEAIYARLWDALAPEIAKGESV